MNKSMVAASVLIVGGLSGLASSSAISDTQGGLNIANNDSVYVDGKSFQVIPGKAKGDAAGQIKNLAARDLGPAAIIIRSGNKLYIADAQGQMARPPVQVAAAPSYAYDPQTYSPRVVGGGSAGYNSNVATDYAYDPKGYYRPNLVGAGSTGYNGSVATDYAYDPRGYQPALIGGGSVGYNHQVATDYAYDPRSYNPTLAGGGSAGYNTHVVTDYAYDPRAGYPIRDPNPWAHDYAYDPHTVSQPSLIYDPDYVEYRLKKAFADNWTPMGATASAK
jgi:hypothetical protein